ncbi:MAG: tetratricopeptide repeat protein [Steroidobacterales bacterium]
MKRFVGVLVVTGAALLLPGAAAYAADKAQQPSPKVGKPLHEAQEDIKAKKYAEALGKIKEAQGVDKKTPYDEHVINDMLAFVLIKTNDLPGAAKAMEAEIDDGMTPAGEVPQKIKALAEIHYQLKNYDKSIEFGNRAIKGGFADEGIKTIVGQSYYLKGDYKSAQKYEDNLVDQEIKAGETPKNEQLMLLYSACQKANDDACTEKALEKMVTYYPKPESWAQLLFNVRRQVSGNEANLMETYRLMFDTDVLKDPGDYSEMAGLCLDGGSPGEAQKVLQRGLDRNAFNDQRTKDRAQRKLEAAKKRAASDQGALANLEQEANGAATGDKNAAVGRAYLGYEQYDKAIDQLQKALSKGVSKDEPRDRLLLGVAQLKGGHKDDAIKTFKSVKGDPALERLAGLWVLHSKSA